MRSPSEVARLIGRSVAVQLPTLAEGILQASIEQGIPLYRLQPRLDLGDYYLFHAIRADLLSRLGRNAEASQAYDAALRLTSNLVERSFLVPPCHQRSGRCPSAPWARRRRAQDGGRELHQPTR